MINSNSNKPYNDDKEVNVVVEDDHPLTIIKKKDPSFQLSFLPSSLLSSPTIQIAIWKDTRLEQLDISKYLIELLYINGFTIERILEYGPLQIGQLLGIDESYAQLIFNEATKRIN